MSAETSLYSTLSAASGVTSLVGTRIYPDVLPEGCDYPAVVFSRMKTDPLIGVSGQRFGADVELAVGVWSKTRTSADAVASAVSSALVPLSGFAIIGQEAAYDPESGLFATTLTALFFEA